MAEPTEAQIATWKQMHWATSLITGRFRRDLAGSELRLEEFDVLIHLAEAPSGTLPLNELTASMVVADALSRSGITRLLDRLEREGLIRRTTVANDRRRFDVSLTKRGRRRFENVWPGHAFGIGKYFVEPLEQHDIDELSRILARLIRANEADQ